MGKLQVYRQNAEYSQRVLAIFVPFDFSLLMLRRARYLIATSSRLSVRLSVTLRYRDYIGWISSKIISRLVSLGCSLSQTPTLRIYSKRNSPEFWLE